HSQCKRELPLPVAAARLQRATSALDDRFGMRAGCRATVRRGRRREQAACRFAREFRVVCRPGQQIRRRRLRAAAGDRSAGVVVGRRTLRTEGCRIDTAPLRGAVRGGLPPYLLFFFSCLAARFSFIVLAGFFFSLFFESMPLLMLFSSVRSVGWTCGARQVYAFSPARVRPAQMRSFGAR